jgi:hypothetical protein
MVSIFSQWEAPRVAGAKPGGPLWSAGYLKDNWIDTDLPETKFESNLKFLGQQLPVADQRIFYRVENTVMPKADNPVLCVSPSASTATRASSSPRPLPRASATSCRSSPPTSSTATSSTPAPASPSPRGRHRLTTEIVRRPTRAPGAHGLRSN